MSYRTAQELSCPLEVRSADRSPGSRRPGATRTRRNIMNGYVAQRRGRFYAVIYEGRDPVTGKERRTLAPRRHRSGQGRAARREAGRRRNQAGRRRAVADLRRLPDQPVAAGQEAAPRHEHLPRATNATCSATSCPSSGRTSIRRMRYQQIESLYDTLLHPDDWSRSCTQDRLRDPPHHPRRAHRRPPARTRDPQRRARGPRPQATVAATDRGRRR